MLVGCPFPHAHLPSGSQHSGELPPFLSQGQHSSKSQIAKALAGVEASLRAGGAEHAVLHLLYARFWHKVLYDIGLVSRKEPFQSLVSQGMILGEVGHEQTGVEPEWLNI